MAPIPKPASLRQRRNRVSSAATLTDDGARRRVPSLPKDREWRPETRSWWREVWRSPMASEYLAADRHGLVLLATLIESYWRDPSLRKAAEIRTQEARFGLSPIDRRRLQWEVKRVDGPKTVALPRRARSETDPRDLLSIV